MWKTTLIDGVGLRGDQVCCVGVMASIISRPMIKAIETIAFAITRLGLRNGTHFHTDNLKTNTFQGTL